MNSRPGKPVAVAPSGSVMIRRLLPERGLVDPVGELLNSGDRAAAVALVADGTGI
jgi:hypothetical protein